MARPEAEAALGLKDFTVATVAAAGAIHYVKGPERNFPARWFFFLREDVMKIKQAFEKHFVPVTEYSKPGEFIALRHAMKNYPGRDSGLAAVIRAVVDGLSRADGSHKPVSRNHWLSVPVRRSPQIPAGARRYGATRRFPQFQ